MDSQTISRYEPDFDVGTTPPPMIKFRDWVRAVLADLHADVIYDVELAATELIANAYEHGGGVLAVRLSRPVGGPARLEVDDARPNLPLTAGRSTAGTFRGQGLRIVNAIAEAWGVDQAIHRKTVWADLPVHVASTVE
jgi:histidine kinase-like protein